MTNKIIQGAKEALAFAKGEKLKDPVRVITPVQQPDGSYTEETYTVHSKAELDALLDGSSSNKE